MDAQTSSVPEIVSAPPAGAMRPLAIFLRVIEHIAAAVLAIDVVIVFISVIYRYFLHNPIEWTEEIASALMGVLIFLGAATVLGRRQHMGITTFRQMFPAAWQGVMERMAAWVVLGVSGVMLASSCQLLIDSADQTTPLGLPGWIFVWPAIIGGVGMVVFAVANVFTAPSKCVWTAFAFCAVVVGAVAGWNSWADPASQIAPIFLLVGGFFLCLALGVPIAFTVAFSAMVYFIADSSVTIMIFSQQVVAGGGYFVLLAIPFFILAGLAMEANGMSTRLFELLLRMLGNLRGGLNLIVIVATMIFSGISGSKLADVAAVGGIVIPVVRRTRQSPEHAAGLLACTAVMAEAIPPCVNLIVLGFVANISIGGLFMAGIVPAVFLAIGLGTVAVIGGQRVDVKDAFPHRTPLPRLIGGALIAFVMVFMIGRGVVAGVATSTEISAFAVVYAFVVGGLAFRELTPKLVVDLFVRSASIAGSILFIVATASALSFALTIEQIPRYLSESMTALGHDYGVHAFVIVTVVITIFFGAILEGAPALIIFGPLFVPIAQALGIPSFQFGVIMVLSMGFGMFAPPVGMGLFATCAVSQTRIEDVSRAMIKYLCVLAAGILVLIFVPQISLWLPSRLGFQ